MFLMVSRIGAVALVAAMASVMPPAGAAPAPPASRSAPPAAAPKAGPADVRSTGTTTPAAPQISQDAAARARMHECAHQWAAIKKAGTAGTTTWKDFSATCLVVSR